jgi:hypothetical protein
MSAPRAFRIAAGVAVAVASGLFGAGCGGGAASHADGAGAAGTTGAGGGPGSGAAGDASSGTAGGTGGGSVAGAGDAGAGGGTGGPAGTGSAAGASGTSGVSGGAGASDGGTAQDAKPPTDSGTAGTGSIAGDTFLPWAGGAAYYKKWTHGPPSDASFWPTMVWLQSPPNATKYKNVGINFFVGLYQGPTEAQLTALAAAGIPTICDQAGVWKAHANDKTIAGWLQPDEPDNAQANGQGGYDPCIAPSTIVSGYQTMVANDATRPVMLGLGRGVADTMWVGRGTCTGMTSMYPMYAMGGDILAFDIYPVNEGVPLEMVPAGVDNLIKWSGGAKPVIADIEASNFNNTARPSPAQIRSEVWMAIVHGAAGTQYFCHRFTPTFSETDCLDDAPTAAAMKSINAQLATLAPVLNTPPIGNGVTVKASAAAIPVDVLLKRQGGATYLFATEMRAGATTATFTFARLPATASAEVLGESRTLPVTGGVLKDDFQSYGVHLYKLTY